jgi:hypothetical protein
MNSPNEELWSELLRQVFRRVPEDFSLDGEVPKGRCSDVWSRLWDSQWATNYDLDM